jgi:hypothetical protein
MDEESAYRPNWEGISDDKKALILVLASNFGEAVESFGLIHGGKKIRDRAFEVAMAQLGIQQARLLAWGDMVGVLEVSPERDEALENPTKREPMENAIHNIINLIRSKENQKQLQNYGLKSMLIPLYDLEVALDWTRHQSFRE